MSAFSQRYVEELEGRVARLRKELDQANDLIEYYRDLAPDMPGINIPPPGFFIHEKEDSFLVGRLINGDLDIIEQGLPSRELAAAKAWEIQRKLTGGSP